MPVQFFFLFFLSHLQTYTSSGHRTATPARKRTERQREREWVNKKELSIKDKNPLATKIKLRRKMRRRKKRNGRRFFVVYFIFLCVERQKQYTGAYVYGVCKPEMDTFIRKTVLFCWFLCCITLNTWFFLFNFFSYDFFLFS